MQAAVPGCFVKRRWGRGPQKSPPETFVRGLAVPPCSTPVTMPKKDPKKLCAFWGFISVPVVGVEPTRCHHQRILSPSRLPIPTHRLICCLYSILQACQKIKIYFALIFTPQIRSKSTLDIPRIIGLSFVSAVCWKWQTRRTQNPLVVTPYGFDPHHRHSLYLSLLAA